MARQLIILLTSTLVAILGTLRSNPKTRSPIWINMIVIMKKTEIIKMTKQMKIMKTKKINKTIMMMKRIMMLMTKTMKTMKIKKVQEKF